MRFTRAMGFAGALAFLLLGLFCGFKGIGNLRRASGSTHLAAGRGDRGSLGHGGFYQPLGF